MVNPWFVYAVRILPAMEPHTRACETVAPKERARAALAQDSPQNARDLLRSAQTYEHLAARCMRLSKLL